MPGYWKRPISRMYSYNLELGEHYYYPMSHYLDNERGTRGETPGALTYSERLARKWLYGRKYGATDASERYCRASSVARGEGMAAAASQRAASYLENEMSSRYNRAASEMRSSSSAAQSSQMAASRSCQKQQQQQSSVQQSSSCQSKKSVQFQRQNSLQSTSVRRQVNDDVQKVISDLHIQPWNQGRELEEATSASMRAKARIADLERELDEITKRAMSTQSIALKSASQMAKAAMMEDEAACASSMKRSRKVVMEESKRAIRG